VAEIIKAGLIQQSWTGDKDSMIRASVDAIGRAASAGAAVICLQELFYGPYFCQVQDADYYSYTEAIPDGPTTQLMCELAKRHSVVLVVPMYEEEQPGVYYNTACVIERDGSVLGKYRKTHIPHTAPCFWEKFYFKPGNLGYPVFDTSVGRLGLIICYDRHFPEVARELGLKGAELVFNPSATVESEIHAGLAVADERAEVAVLRRRKGDAVLHALAHARIGGEDDVPHPSERGLGWRLRPREPRLDRSRPRHAPIIGRPPGRSRR